MQLLIASSLDPFFLRSALGLFILGVGLFCLKQVADVLERQARLRELEEYVRLQEIKRSGSSRDH